MKEKVTEGTGKPSSPERERPLVGIWLVPLTPDQQTFVVLNTKARFASQKVPGQWNNPAETYEEKLDRGSFRHGTLPRAIEEEIGELVYDPTRVTALGFVELKALRAISSQRVYAAPYLIPVEGIHSLTFKPKDSESGEGRWIHLNEIDQSEFRLGPYKLPVYRTPQLEIAAMVKTYLEKRVVYPYIKSQAPLIPPELYAFLKVDSGPNRLAQ